MELSEHLRSGGAVLDMIWLPREQNVEEADNLTNEIYTDFDFANRIEIQEGMLKFLVLDNLQSAAQELYKDLLDEKELRTINKPAAGKATWARNKLSIKERLKWKSPW